MNIKIRGVIEGITYQNPENGWSVLKARVKGYDNLVTFVGSMLDVPVGSVLVASGSWKVDAKFGHQFAVESFEEALPASIYGIEKYLGSGLVKGIGPTFARAIVAKFGTETLEIIDTDPDRLIEVPRLGRRRVERIKESWEKQKDIKEVMVFLQSVGVSTSFAAKIYRQYGKESVAVVKDNPYRLADDIWGIGFKTADGIAANMGYGKNDPRRCRSGILYTLNELADNGHVYAEPEQLVKAAVDLLEAEEEAIRTELGRMTVEKDVIAEDGIIYLPPFFHSESGSARLLTALLDSPGSSVAADDSAVYSSANGIVYDDVQRAAIEKAVESKVMVLTGGPGTGKTTTTQGIIEAYKTRGMRILLAAPTGRAAKRMTEATGMEAKTIHRLLEYNPQDGFKHNEENPLDGDALIVDECSMIDIILFYNLMKAVPRSMRLVLVGDIDQLPSVGAGNVLRDIIDSQRIPVVRLTRIFRQAQSSRIIMNAHAINSGMFPNISNGQDTDFFFIRVDEAEAIPSTIVNLVRERLPRKYRYPAREIQVLTPMQRGDVGAANINMLLQEALNPSGAFLTRSGYHYRLGDKVMQLRNDYDKNVFNGDIGYITAVDESERTLQVTFDDRMVDYDVTELDELALAYAITIHKSQGSEFPIVVMPVTMKHYVMLQRNLIYTGITRAKKICVLVGTTRAIAYAICNNPVCLRNTRLKERLQS
jgi:exodeoxyribonuclease V alpha subunit